MVVTRSSSRMSDQITSSHISSNVVANEVSSVIPIDLPSDEQSDVNSTHANTVFTEVTTKLADISPANDTERLLIQCMNILIRENSRLSAELRESNVKLDQLSFNVKDSVIMSAKAEQYSRRDTMLVSGLVMEDHETPVDLGKKVCQELSKSGVNVTPKDFTALHRNANKPKFIQKKGEKITVHPSVTVKFHNISKKDEVLRKFSNFDRANNKKRKVRAYQSLSKYYTDLKRMINTYCLNHKVELSWIHYRSPTCGLAVKLKTSNRLLTKIHCEDDFLLVI